MPDGLLPVAPDLVVEVRSPSDGWSEIFTKVARFEQVDEPAHLRSNFTGGIKHLRVTAHAR